MFGGSTSKKSGSKSSNDPLAALSRMLSLKRMGGSLLQKLHRQRKKAKKQKRRQRRRSTRLLNRQAAELARQAAADTLCKGGVPTTGMSGIRREHFEPLTKYVARMIRCQGHSRRSTALLKEKSTYEIYEKSVPLFHVTLDVQGPPPPSAAALKAATGNGGVIPAHLMLSAEENKPSLRFEPPLPSFELKLQKVMNDMIVSINEWKHMNVDMLMPFEGHKSRDHRGFFENRSSATISTEDVVVSSMKERLRVALRSSNSCLMALVLHLQKYKKYFYFDPHQFNKWLQDEQKEAAKTRGVRRKRYRKNKQNKQNKQNKEKNLAGCSENEYQKKKEKEDDDAATEFEETEEKENTNLNEEMENFELDLISDFERVDRCELFIQEMNSVLVDELDLHAYRVDMRSFKSQAIGNSRMRHALLLKDVQRKAMNICREMNTKFGTYFDTISKWPKTVEEFDLQMHAVDLFDKTVGNLGSQIFKLDTVVNGLETRKFVSNDRDFQDIWKARGWPKRLTEARDKCMKNSTSHRSRFESELEDQKKMFSAQVRRLRESFIEITKKGPSQWKESDSVANDVKTLSVQLEEASDENDQIRKRCEVLGISFDQDSTSSSGMSLTELRTHVLPFSELWESVTTWRRYQPEWIDGPFLVLDSEDVAEYIRQCWRDMYRLIRVFDTDLYDEPVKVGNRLKKSVEEFKLYLPLITKLRNEHLRPRHWNETSKELGVYLKVDHSLTLRMLLANGSMEAIETISDISLTATLEVKFERSLDQLEAAWEVTGKPNDLPMWEKEEKQRLHLIAMEEKRLAEEQIQMKQSALQKNTKSTKDTKNISNSNTNTTTTTVSKIKPLKLPPPPPPPICEALYVTFRAIRSIKSHALDNPEELLRVLEDHITTTTKLTTSPYALPFAKRVQALRDQQDEFLNLLFVWIEMQRIWLELRPLCDQKTLRQIRGVSGGEVNEIYLKCDKQIRKIISKWYNENQVEHEGYPPSPLSMLKTNKILLRVEGIHRTLQNVKKDVVLHLQDVYWSNAPRTRYLDMEQCLRLNALEYYPDEMDHVVALLFPGVRRFLIEPENGLNGDQENDNNEEDVESDDTEEDEEGNPLVLKNDEEEDEDDDVIETVVSGQHFRNMMQEVHVLPPSTLCGFGTKSHHSNHHGADGFYFTTPVELFTKGAKSTTAGTASTAGTKIKKSKKTNNNGTRTPRPLVSWLSECETAMRVTLLDRITHAYEVCSIYHENNLATEASESFFEWLKEQSTQVVEISMKIMHTHEMEQMFRIINDGDTTKKEEKKDQTKNNNLSSLLNQMSIDAENHISRISLHLRQRRQNRNQSSSRPSTAGSSSKRNVFKDRDRERSAMETCTTYITVLIEQRDRCHLLSQKMKHTTIDPLESFDWMGTLRYYLSGSRSDDSRAKPDQAKLSAIAFYQTPHCWLSPLDQKNNSQTALTLSSSKTIPKPYLKNKTKNTIEVHIGNASYRHSLEFYGQREWRVSINPLTERVLRATLLAHRACDSVCLSGANRTSSIPGGAFLSQVARSIGMPYHEISMSGNGSGEDRLMLEITRCVATGHWLHINDLQQLSKGVLSLLTTTMLSLSHSKRSESGTVVIGGVHKIDVTHGWSLTISSTSSLSNKFLKSIPSTFTVPFRPITLTTPNASSVIEAILRSIGLSMQKNMNESDQVRTFAKGMEKILQTCRMNQIGTCCEYTSALALVRSSLYSVAASSIHFITKSQEKQTTVLIASLEQTFNELNGSNSMHVDLFRTVVEDVFQNILTGNTCKENDDESNNTTEVVGRRRSITKVIEEIEEIEEIEDEEDRHSEYDLLLSKELYFSFERMGLVATPSSIHYAMLLHEVLRDGNTLSNTEGTSGGESEEPSRNARRGVLLVGPSGVGKTSITKVLADAISRVDATVVLNISATNKGNGNNSSNKNSSLTDRSSATHGVEHGVEGEDADKGSDTDSDEEEGNYSATVDKEYEHEVRKHQVEITRLFPNSVSLTEWRGCVHSKTGIWRDGLLKETLKRIQNDRFGPRGIHFKHSRSQRWLVIDGNNQSSSSSSMSSSSSWFDDLNSLLLYNMDGKTSNWSDSTGAVISSNARLRVILETDSLIHLTPGQLSSLPIVRCSSTGMEWQALITGWLRKIRMTHPAIRRVLNELTGTLALLLPSLMAWIADLGTVDGCSSTTTMSSATMTSFRFVTNVLKHLEIALSPFCPLKGRQLSRRVQLEAKKRKKQVSLSLITLMKQPIASEWTTANCQKHVQGITTSTILACASVFFDSSLHKELSNKINNIMKLRKTVNAKSSTRGNQNAHGKARHAQDMGHDEHQHRWLESRTSEILITLPKEGKDENGFNISILDYMYSFENIKEKKKDQDKDQDTSESSGQFVRWSSSLAKSSLSAFLHNKKNRIHDKETMSCLESLYDTSPHTMFAGDLIIPTDGLARATMMCAVAVGSGTSCLVLGRPSTGKTLLLRKVREWLDEESTAQLQYSNGKYK